MINLILDSIKKRALPGVLIFDADFRLLHFNREALEILSGRSIDVTAEGRPLPLVPDQIMTLCERLKADSTGSGPENSAVQSCELLDPISGERISLRASYMGTAVDGQEPRHIMVLVEKIVERRKVDLEMAQKQFRFSKKEMEVLEYICSGLPNRKIAEKMYISEYTVKNHIKKIMRRMRVNSRSEILVTLR